MGCSPRTMFAYFGILFTGYWHIYCKLIMLLSRLDTTTGFDLSYSIPTVNIYSLHRTTIHSEYGILRLVGPQEGLKHTINSFLPCPGADRLSDRKKMLTPLHHLDLLTSLQHPVVIRYETITCTLVIPPNSFLLQTVKIWLPQR